MATKVNEGVAHGGKFTKVSRLELVKGEEAAKLIGPELVRVEQVVELSGLEIPAQEEVAEVSGKLVGPEGVYKQVRRKVTGIKEFMEIPIREELWPTRAARTGRAGRKPCIG